MKYSDKLRDPRWQKKRLEVFQKWNWTCEDCGSANKTLEVHHVVYRKNKEPWEHPLKDLMCLCSECHEARKGTEISLRQSLNAIIRLSNHDTLKKLDTLLEQWTHDNCDLGKIDLLVAA